MITRKSIFHKTWSRTILDIFSSLVWVYILCLLLGFSPLGYLASVAGSPWAELLETRFFVLAVFLLLLFVAFPWKKLWPHFLYMLCFPLIFLLWRIPSRLWRSNEPFGTLIYFNVLSSAALSVADWLRIFLLIFIGFVLTVHITNPIAFQLGAAFLFVGLAGH